jgi:uncharacterized protein (TIGR02678 family)
VVAFAEDETSEALLSVRRELVRHLLAVPLREVDDPDELVRLAAEPGPGGGARHRVRRLLVEEPAVLLGDVDDEAWLWLRQSQRREARTFEELFGLQLEIRAEGVAAIDPRDELSDEPFPRGGTLGHAALLAVAELVRRLRPADSARDDMVGTVSVPLGLLDEIVGELLHQHGRRWRRDYSDRPDRLSADVEDLLVDVGLVRRDPDGGLRLAAIAARYDPAVVETAAILSLDDPELSP